VICGAKAVRKTLNDEVCESGYRRIREIIHPEGVDDHNDHNDHSDQDHPMNLKAVQQLCGNPDIAAWIDIPCIGCSYPVLQGNDNSYYLSHNAQREPAFAGSIILDCESRPDFSSANSVLYGHNMLNGTMFGRLWYIPYRNASEAEPFFWIFTDREALRYRIFTAFGTDRTSEAFKLFDEGSDDFDAWCYSMREQSLIDTGEFSYEPDMKVVTLTTCGSTPWYRTIVSGVLEEKIQIVCN